jgi:hypothetical protein
VEYLLVDMPAAFPVEPMHSFAVPSGSNKQFAVENRANVGEIQVSLGLFLLIPIADSLAREIQEIKKIAALMYEKSR